MFHFGLFYAYNLIFSWGYLILNGRTCNEHKLFVGNVGYRFDHFWPGCLVVSMGIKAALYPQRLSIVIRASLDLADNHRCGPCRLPRSGPPTYCWSTMSLRKFNPFGSNSRINATRPPPYDSETTATRYGRSVSDCSGTFMSLWSMASPDTDSVFDKPADTDSSIMSFVDITRHEGPRYSEFQAALTITDSTISLSQYTTDYTPRTEQFLPQTTFTPMIRTWGASWLNSSHLLT